MVELLERLLFEHRQANWSRNSSRLARPIFFHGFADAPKPEPHYFALARFNRERVMRGRFSPDPLGVHRAFSTMDDEIIDSILHEPVPARRRKEVLGIGFVLGEKQIATILEMAHLMAQG